MKWKLEKASMNTELSNLRCVQQNLSKELDRVQQEWNAHNSMVETQKAELEEYKAQHESLLEQVEMANSDVARLQQIIQEHEETILEVREELQLKIQNLKSVEDAHSQEFKTIEDALRTELDSLKAEVERTEISNKSLSDTNLSLEYQVSHLQNVESELNSVKKFSTDELNKLRMENQALQTKVDDLMAAKKKLEEKSSMLDNDIMAKANELEACKTTLIAKAKSLAAAEDLAKTDGDLKTQYMRQLEGLTTDLAVCKEKLAATTTQLERERADTLSKTASANNALEEAEAMRIKIKQFEEKSALDSQQVDLYKFSFEEKDAKIKSLEKQVSDLHGACQEQQLRIETLQNLENLERNHVILNEKLRREIHDLEDGSKSLQDKLQAEARWRRNLQEKLSELKGTIRVFCRVRPLLPHEVGRDDSLQIDEQEGTIVVQESKANFQNHSVTRKTEFQFDRVFGTSATNQEIFEEVDLLLQSVLNGVNCCIFAYGQTSSGKTYTMLSSHGIVNQAIHKIFEIIDVTSYDFEYTLKGSFVEIYNDHVYDLSSSDANKTEIISHTFTNCQEIFDLFKTATQNRSVASTKMNDRSSRSHTVFTLEVKCHQKSTGKETSAKLNLIDLAGSERLDQSGATGARLKETQAINKSLSALGDVIHALNANYSHVPFRSSKLTQILQDSLSKKSKTLMVVNVSPSLANLSETVTSLRFAQKVNQTKLRSK